MTDSEPIASTSLRRDRAMLALLTATAALASGTQALAPTPALAMNKQGNECQNLPTWERTVCEMENGGGSGAGGAGNTNGDQGGPTIGHETIEVDGSAPPPRCSFCLPSQIGGGHLGLSDRGGKNPREPRHHGRPVRVAETPKENEKTKEECALLHGKIAALEEAEKQAGLRADAARRHLRDARDLWFLTVNERSRLAGEVDSPFRSWWPWKGKLRDLEKRYAEVQANIESLERGMRLSYQDLDQARSLRRALVEKRLRDLYHFAEGGCRWTD